MHWIALGKELKHDYRLHGDDVSTWARGRYTEHQSLQLHDSIAGYCSTIWRRKRDYRYALDESGLRCRTHAVEHRWRRPSVLVTTRKFFSSSLWSLRKEESAPLVKRSRDQWFDVRSCCSQLT